MIVTVKAILNIWMVSHGRSLTVGCIYYRFYSQCNRIAEQLFPCWQVLIVNHALWNSRNNVWIERKGRIIYGEKSSTDSRQSWSDKKVPRPIGSLSDTSISDILGKSLDFTLVVKLTLGVENKLRWLGTLIFNLENDTLEFCHHFSRGHTAVPLVTAPSILVNPFPSLPFPSMHIHMHAHTHSSSASSLSSFLLPELWP